METWINLVAVVGSAAALYFLLRRPVEKLEERIDALEGRFDARFDRIERELVEFRIETRKTLARHDERLAALERPRPGLIIP